jgi:hypothetical protein
LVNGRRFVVAEKTGGSGMEEKEKAPSEEKTQKVVWGYVGKATLWVGLVLFGLAVERLGLTSGILAETVPGEVQRLRAKIAETRYQVQTAQKERRKTKMRILGLEDSSLFSDLERCRKEVEALEAGP